MQICFLDHAVGSADRTALRTVLVTGSHRSVSFAVGHREKSAGVSGSRKMALSVPFHERIISVGAASVAARATRGETFSFYPPGYKNRIFWDKH